MKKIITCCYRAFFKMIEHDGIEHSGYMSFMVLLSIFPFLVFLLALTSFFGASELGQNFIKIFLESMPEQATDSLKNRIKELSSTPPQSLMTIAIVGSVWTASSFVECLRTILNRVYEIKSPPTYIRRRLLSIIQFLVISILITFAMFILVVTPFILAKIPVVLEFINAHRSTINFIRYIFILTILFFGASSLYYILPNAALKFTDVTPGAFLTVILWVITGNLLSAYLIYYNQLNLIYGSLGSIIITLIFFYIINIIFIFGAEFNFLLKKNQN